jgi:hypothetical protein
MLALALHLLLLNLPRLLRPLWLLLLLPLMVVVEKVCRL